ncbi:hypothetical protein GGER_15740 [Serratia rubidaea]
MVAKAELTDANITPNAQMIFFIKHYPSLKRLPMTMGYLMQMKLIIGAEFYTMPGIQCQRETITVRD